MSAWFAHRRRPVVTALAPSAAYELWAPSYPAEPHNALMRVEQAAVLDVLPDVTGLTVLDAACGTGRYARLLEARAAAAIIGVDLTTAMLERARRPGAHLIRADLCALPLASSSIDVAVCGLALNDVRGLDPAVRLSPRGEWQAEVSLAASMVRLAFVLVCYTVGPLLGWLAMRSMG